MRSKYLYFKIVKIGGLGTYAYWPHTPDYYTKAFRTVVRLIEDGPYLLYSVIDKEIGIFK